MEIEIKYSEAFEQHPEMVDKWVKEALKSNTKFNPEKAKWSYSFGQSVEGMRGDMFAKKLATGELFREKEVEMKKTPEQVVKDNIESVVGLSFSVSHAGFKREKSITETPKLFLDKFGAIIMESENKKIAEQERISKLTPEERQREEDELVSQLHEMGGFAGFNIGQSGISRIQPKKVTYNIDQILDKVSRVGVNGLTEGERKFLDDHSNKMNKS